MKNRHILFLLLAVLLLCAGLSVWLLKPGKAASAQLLWDGQVIRTVDLSIDQTFTVPAPGGGSNTISVRDGKIAVTEATCPDHVCMSMGWRQGGAPIACLPNGLIISFSDSSGVDAMAG